jgi:phage terminase small subunit
MPASAAEPTRQAPAPAASARQGAFVDAFVGNGGDASAAAQAAGYTSRRLDHRVDDLLRHPVVTAEIARRTTRLLGRLAPKPLPRSGG